MVGFIEEGVAAQIHNSLAVLRNGTIAFLHRKLNLATFGKLEEGKHFAGGRYLETFNLGPRWRAGTLICADSWNPALVHLAAVQGATLLLLPVASALGVVGGEFSNPLGWQRALDFYAMVYGMPLAMANFAGEQNGALFWGGSRVLDPYGNCLEMPRILITSALPYINGIKHLGNLVGSMLPADVYARFKRQQGDETLFICATDEHGTPAELAALAAGQDVADYCREQHEIQKKAGAEFGLSFDHFGRSSNAPNHKLTQHFAHVLEEKGLIEERTDRQVYSASP